MQESYRVGIYDSIIPKSRHGNVKKNYVCFKDSQFTLAVVAVAIIVHHLLAVHFWTAEVSPATSCYTDIGYITPRCLEQHVHI